MRKIILCSTIVLTSFFFTNCQKEKPNEETPIKPTETGIGLHGTYAGKTN